MKRFFGRFSGPAPLIPSPGRLARLDALRTTVRGLLIDCASPAAKHLRWKIDACQDAPALWQLRAEIHMCLAREHSESVAAERINGLLVHFRGLVPASQLMPIGSGGQN